MLVIAPRSVAFLLVVLGGAWVAGAQDAAPPAAAEPATEIRLDRMLVIGSLERSRRAAVHTDLIEAALVGGTWTPPQAGDEIKGADGRTAAWEAAVADDKGWVTHAALRGGYAYAAVESTDERALLLAAAGHSLVYVNGEPRAGDPYRTGYVRLPVLLRPGTNHFLFRCGRGQVRARLVEPESRVSLNVSDATLPDLIVGERPDVWAAVVVLNAGAEQFRGGQIVAHYADASTVTPVPPVPAFGVRKVGFRVAGPEPAETGEREIALTLQRGESPPYEQLAEASVQLRVRRADESYKRTFISAIDESVQYYAVQPARPAEQTETRPALFLTLHGAGVEALGQANAYARKSWGHVVAPTNRRPFGFDWEDWGRLDAMEVLALAEKRLGTDPQRVYLLGHSMGGHGVWQIGATFPDRFAAIAPSAGWISFWSYTGAQRFEEATPVEEILTRATNPSDTLALSRNYLHCGVYILHGERDDNVPVEQARTMRSHLAEYHADFAYYERPGAGHWWGNACVDWPPLFDFLKSHTRPETHEVRHVEFVTANPAISATCDWATIEQQIESLKFSKIDLRVDEENRRIHGNTENVARLRIALVPRPVAPAGAIVVSGTGDWALLEPGKSLTVELDGQKLKDVPWPARGWAPLCLARRHDQWAVLAPTESVRDSQQKNQRRAGPFKEVFNNRVQLVYGTRGGPEENAWAYAKARYDAETFWYRGNGALDVIPDAEFDPDATPERSVVLYGNACTNAAWATLLARSPVQVHGERVHVGERHLEADDLAVLAIYPRPGSDAALVGAVGGTGITGMRLTDRLPYFVSGVAYPDWIVLGPQTLHLGADGVLGAGFFDNEWRIDPQQSAWR